LELFRKRLNLESYSPTIICIKSHFLDNKISFNTICKLEFLTTVGNSFIALQTNVWYNEMNT
jgi:hypothetical protein